ncbi:MAG: c-type cytochrome, partial [Planctomycetaceae bacterium]|nr:c-type cytochrome [Planctomycetaceae bacterium]
KILPLGAGSLDVELLKTIRDSGYTGPIGILNHTQENAELRLQDNLDGLAWIEAQLAGQTDVPRPQYRTWKPPIADAAATSRGMLLPADPQRRELPLTVECRAQLNSSANYNILVASDTKRSGEHWELFSMRGDGTFTVYVPGYQPDHVRSDRVITDRRTHALKMEFESSRVRLFVDGEQVADQSVMRNDRPAAPGGLGIGRLVEGGIFCDGVIESVTMQRGDTKLLAWSPEVPSETKPVPTASNQSPPYDPAFAPRIIAAAITQGDLWRGAEVITQSRFACVSCHRIGQQGGTIGPELTASAKKQTAEHLVESVAWPRHKVADEFTAQAILTTQGQVRQGYVVQETPQQLTLRDPQSGDVIEIPVAEIEERRVIGTLMPEGLFPAMTQRQQLDLVALLVALRDADADMIARLEQLIERSRSHAPAVFAYDNTPLLPEHWPSHREHVNRDRIYD